MNNFTKLKTLCIFWYSAHCHFTDHGAGFAITKPDPCQPVVIKPKFRTRVWPTKCSKGTTRPVIKTLQWSAKSRYEITESVLKNVYSVLGICSQLDFFTIEVKHLSLSPFHFSFIFPNGFPTTPQFLSIPVNIVMYSPIRCFLPSNHTF